ncbi:MAG: HEAT repeat domain-containing protein [Deltaproteobacteria bacterium]|nr:HEAT repeat domain-containing protein [Deltaproteobacteria bacterium]
MFLEVLGWSDADAPSPSRAAFERMVQESPARLAAWVFEAALPRGHLSHAAEILGRGTASCAATSGVEFVLTRLLEHPSPVVREGAVYGLGFHLSPAVRQTLERLSHEDPSDGVREAAEEVLEG